MYPGWVSYLFTGLDGVTHGKTRTALGYNSLRRQSQKALAVRLLVLISVAPLPLWKMKQTRMRQQPYQDSGHAGRPGCVTRNKPTRNDRVQRIKDEPETWLRSSSANNIAPSKIQNLTIRAAREIGPVPICIWICSMYRRHHNRHYIIASGRCHWATRCC
ncbi:hypothetical protein F4778DRAFT_719323 [Xylariomycetidae sp. FL2044]|nr:hypothetical protein F4778DRAFT_719323 [Xylariomycetidae sp. FL2044]